MGCVTGGERSPHPSRGGLQGLAITRKGGGHLTHSLARWRLLAGSIMFGGGKSPSRRLAGERGPEKEDDGY